MNPPPKDWPVTRQGFRLRGQEMTRTETFTDAAFAFAVTLLVISVDAVLSTYHEMVSALGGIPEQLYGVFAIYGIGFVAMTLAVAALNVHAYRCRHDLHLNELESFDTIAEIAAWSLLGLVGAVSVCIALFTTPNPFAWPGWVYAALGVIMPLYGMRMARARRRLEERQGTSVRAASLTKAVAE